jgi:hypothetical protein
MFGGNDSFSICGQSSAMRALGLLIVLPCVIGTAQAEPFIAPLVPGALCRAAIITAERAGALPPQLLAAIGRVESGRRDPVSGRMAPWPWTINAEGQGTFYDTKAQAVAAAQALQARGVRSFDVGCMQINMMHHPNAFTSLEQAFDPSANAAYAVRFLTALHAQTNDWARAAGLYHSATPELGAAYESQVATALTEERRLTSGGLPLVQPWSMAPVGMQAAAGLRYAGGVPATIPHLAAGVGRDLAAYRSAPILYAVRAPVAIRRN